MARAVSDVVGFVLVFSLVTLVVGTVYLSGLGGLDAARDAERVINGERAFDVLSENVDDVVDTGTQSRATEIKLSDAHVGFGAPVQFRVNVTNTTQNFTTNTTPIVFSIGDQAVVYSNGAVIRAGPSGSAMLNEPSMIAGDRALVPLLVMRGRGSGVGGSGRVLVRTVEATSDVIRYDATDPDEKLAVTVTTPRPRAWETYLEDRFGADCSVSGDTVTCTPVDVTRVDLQVVKVDVYVL